MRKPIIIKLVVFFKGGGGCSFCFYLTASGEKGRKHTQREREQKVLYVTSGCCGYVVCILTIKSLQVLCVCAAKLC